MQRKKLFHTSPFMHFAFVFSEHERLILLKSLWKCASKIYFKKYKWKVVLLAIYLFNFNLWHLTLSWVRVLSNKLEFFVYCNTTITRTSFSLLCMFWYILFHKNLIVLHHGDSTFLFYFDISIKLTLSTIISRMRKW